MLESPWSILQKPRSSADTNNGRIGLLSPRTGGGIDTGLTEADEEDYHTPQYELQEQNRAHQYLRSLYKYLRQQKGKHNNEHLSNKRTLGRVRMNHLMRFEKRENGKELFARTMYAPKNPLVLEEENQQKSWLEGKKRMI